MSQCKDDAQQWCVQHKTGSMTVDHFVDCLIGKIDNEKIRKIVLDIILGRLKAYGSGQ